jgi:hypothetical protein
MWFGFDWQSKAAVVVIMTFIPVLVNTVAGLTGIRPHGATSDSYLCLPPRADADETTPAGGGALHLQRVEDQLAPALAAPS